MTVIEILKEQFDGMLQDEDCWGLDPAEIYNVIQFNDTKRAMEILDQLGVEYQKPMTAQEYLKQQRKVKKMNKEIQSVKSSYLF